MEAENLEPNLAPPAHDDPYGVVWTAWIGSGETRQLIQKELGFRSRGLFLKYLKSLSISDNFDDFVSGWTVEGELTQEDLDKLSVTGDFPLV